MTAAATRNGFAPALHRLSLWAAIKKLMGVRHEGTKRPLTVMHGSSSVTKDLQDIINKYGGKLKPTWGVPVEEIQLGIKNGVRKINLDTDNRLAMTGAIRKVFAEKPEEFDLRVRRLQVEAAASKFYWQGFAAAPGHWPFGQ